MKKILFYLMLMLIFPSCAQYSKMGEQQYLNNKNGPPLQIPSSITKDEINHYYDLPAPTEEIKTSIVPPNHS